MKIFSNQNFSKSSFKENYQQEVWNNILKNNQ